MLRTSSGRLSRGCILVLLWVSLTGCPLFPEAQPWHYPYPRMDMGVVYEVPVDFGSGNSYHPVVYNGILYSRQRAGLAAIRLSDGTKLWENIREGFQAWSAAVLVGEHLVFAGFTRVEDGQRLEMWAVDQHSGEFVGRASLQVPPEYAHRDYFFQGGWLVARNGRVYLPLRASGEIRTGGFVYLGLFSFEFSPSDFSAAGGELSLRLEYPVSVEQNMGIHPIMDGNTMYLYLAGHGWRGRWEPGEEFQEEEHFRQESVRLVALDLSGSPADPAERELWSTGFSHLGTSTRGHNLVRQQQDFYVYGDDALARVRNGEVIWERSLPRHGAYQLVYHDGVLYTNYIHAVRASDGQLLWEQPHRLIRDSNPVLYGNRLYKVENDGLRILNRHTGEVLGLDPELGVFGPIIQGYIYSQGDILFIQQSERFLAVRLGSER